MVVIWNYLFSCLYSFDVEDLSAKTCGGCILWFAFYCFLWSAFVGWYSDCKNVHCMGNINYLTSFLICGMPMQRFVNWLFINWGVCVLLNVISLSDHPWPFDGSNFAVTETSNSSRVVIHDLADFIFSCDYSHIGCDAMWFVTRIPMFNRNRLLPEDGGISFVWNVGTQL